MKSPVSTLEAWRVSALLRRLREPVEARDRIPLVLFAASFVTYWVTGQLLQEFRGHDGWNYFFNADCPRILSDMSASQSGSTSGNPASVAHPLFVLLTNLPTALLSRALGRAPLMASLLMCHAAMAGSVVLFYSILKRLGQPRSMAAIFAALYALGTSNWVFGSITETYAFMPLALLLVVRLGLSRAPLLLQALAAVLPFGINIVLASYSLLALPVLFAARTSARQWLRRVATFVPLVVLLTISGLALQRHFYPDTNIVNRGGFSGYESWYSKDENAAFLSQRRRLVALHFGAYSVVAPAPRLAPEKISTFMWFPNEAPPAYSRIGRVALGLWLAGLALACATLVRRFRTFGRETLSVLVLVAGWLAGTAVFFVRFGDDLTLYSEFWVGHVLLAFAILIGEALRPRERQTRWLVVLALFAATLGVNNALFVGKLVRNYHQGRWLTL
ncbi:MAG: hypothetical protein QM756_09680 [Polyangiaceae bacterium]